MGIGTRIKQRRESLGLTQEELALAVGYTSKSTINKIEKEINDVSQSKLMELAKTLRTTPSFLLGYDDENDTTIYNDEFIDLLFEDGTSATITSNNKQFLKNVRLWSNTFEKVEFNDDEINELINYAKFIKSKRK